MNKRIRELAKQALQLVADEHTNGDQARLNLDSYTVQDLIQEKFAELIVRECIKLSGDAGVYCQTVFEDLAKEHFGVEE
jgi:hypothetical protein